MRRHTPVLALLALVTGLLAVLTPTTPAVADGPGSGTPWVVTLGDSYISGEAGRWAGSSNASSSLWCALPELRVPESTKNVASELVSCS